MAYTSRSLRSTCTLRLPFCRWSKRTGLASTTDAAASTTTTTRAVRMATCSSTISTTQRAKAPWRGRSRGLAESTGASGCPCTTGCWSGWSLESAWGLTGVRRAESCCAPQRTSRHRVPLFELAAPAAAQHLGTAGTNSATPRHANALQGKAPVPGHLACVPVLCPTSLVFAVRRDSCSVPETTFRDVFPKFTKSA